MKNLKYILPMAIILCSIIILGVATISKKKIQPEPPKISPTPVRILRVQKQSAQMRISSQGAVQPKTASEIVSQVSGVVTSISPSFVAGGFFKKGDVMVSLDSRDYKYRLTQAKQQVAQAELALKLENQEAQIARNEWENLNKEKPPELVAREPQLAYAKATLESAKAAELQAQLNLARTKISAPFTGRVRSKNIDVGQFVSPGMSLAKIYSIDYAEVRLPIRHEELAYLDIQFDFRNKKSYENGPIVNLTANFAGKPHQWEGHISHIEAEIDSRSRMVHVVARVKNPYKRNSKSNDVPLSVGLFVNAEIFGKTINNLYIIPRSAIRNQNQVLIVDSENRLHVKELNIYRSTKNEVYIISGLNENDVICLTQIKTVVNGMEVLPVEG